MNGPVKAEFNESSAAEGCHFDEPEMPNERGSRYIEYRPIEPSVQRTHCGFELPD